MRQEIEKIDSSLPAKKNSNWGEDLAVIVMGLGAMAAAASAAVGVVLFAVMLPALPWLAAALILTKVIGWW